MIAMPLLKLKKFDMNTQTLKMQEELEEFFQEDIKTENEIAELLDVIQASLTYLTHTYSKKEIKIASKKHYQKLVDRKHNIYAELAIDIVNLSAEAKQDNEGMI